MSAAAEAFAERSVPERGLLPAAVRVELGKVSRQLAPRILVGLCALAPLAFALVMRLHAAVPADTLFGRWAGTTGTAAALTVLGFAGSLGLPFVAGILSGDVFAAEDRYGTWQTILTRSCTRGQLFVAKTAAAGAVTTLAVAVAAVSSLVASLVLVGAGPLVGLSGQLVPAGRASELVLASWGFTVLPTLAYVALGLLLSIATRSGIVGVLGPPVVALLTQLLALLGPGEIVRHVLPSTPFDAWHTLLTSSPSAQPLLAGALNSVAYIALFLSAGWLIMRRRVFAGADALDEHPWRAPARAAAAIGAAVGVLIAGSGVGPTGITADRVQAAVGSTFERLVVLQYRWRTHTQPQNAAPQLRSSCQRTGHGSANDGAGDDWSCVLHIVHPQAAAPIGLEVTVRANGCYTADAPPGIVGPRQIRDVRGRTFTNPLYAFDGCLPTL